MSEGLSQLGYRGEAKGTFTHSESHSLASTKNGSLQEVICARMERSHYNLDGLHSAFTFYAFK